MAFQDDLKPTLRGLLRAPGFLAGAVHCLALGLGANAILAATRLPRRGPGRVFFHADIE